MKISAMVLKLYRELVSLLNIINRQNSVNNMNLISAYNLLMRHICTVFHENIFHSIKVIDIREDIIYMQNTTKEHNSVNLGGVMDLVFCMSPDDVLYLYQVSENRD